ncbi:MAG: D-alanine--D-alanine ligase [Clostridiales bacterium]|nr:D-alanine--D-alanine ligase [Clostridiales bacterium]MBR6484825.1 D-alanine--D-alanine ligase [Clostridiales bacterium]
MKIVVLGGGLSPERDVSKKSASLIANALLRKGHEVAVVDLYDGTDSDCDFRKGTDDLFEYAIPETEPDLDQIVADHGGREEWVGPGVIDICKSADVVFVGLHGSHGENGQVQALLDAYNIKYTGCNYLGCALAMDKDISKILVAGSGYKTAKWIKGNAEDLTVEGIEKEIGIPCVVKPIGCGSSCGVSVVKTKDELVKAIDYAAAYKQMVLVEQFITGREITIGILDGKALPIIEIVPHEGFYDYKNKYQAGLTDHICPAKINEADTKKAKELAEKFFEILRMDSYGRIDMIYDEEKSEFWFIEANNLPGMTNTSLVPDAAAAEGIRYDDLVERIALSARSGN